MNKDVFKNRQQDNFERELQRIPLPGTGVHSWTLKMSNYGVMAEIPHSEIINRIESKIPKSRFKRGEVECALRKAAKEYTGKASTNINYNPPVVQIYLPKKETGQKKLKDISKLSPIKLIDNMDKDWLLFLEVMYKPDDVLFIGDTYDKRVDTVKNWKNSKIIPGPFFIPNPLIGRQALTADGKESFRCDNAVKEFMYALAEFDELSFDEQCSFWFRHIKSFNIAAIIHSGNKSLHTLIRVDCKDRKEWEIDVKETLFDKFLIPQGADKACKNPARLSRMPSFYRKGKQQQRLIYLNESV